MIHRLALAVALLLALIPPVARAEPDRFTRFGLYVVAADLERSAAFYEALFGRAPYVRTPGLAGFDVAGGLFAVISRATYGGGARGENVAPYIRVADSPAEFERVRALPGARLVTPAIVTEGTFSFFRFQDPDGNVLEFFAVSGPPPG